MQESGNYDHEAEKLLESQNADLVILLVIGGDRGDGFTVCSHYKDSIKAVPEMLRHLADGIESGLPKITRHFERKPCPFRAG